MAECAGPENDFRFREIFLDEIERAGSVANVTDVHALPGATPKDAGRAPFFASGGEE